MDRACTEVVWGTSQTTFLFLQLKLVKSDFFTPTHRYTRAQYETSNMCIQGRVMKEDSSSTRLLLQSKKV